MKKIFILIASFAAFFTACDPNQEIYEELDALKKDRDGKIATISLTLTDKDYGNAGNDAVKANKYFVTADEAKQFIPVILTKRTEYSLVGTGSSVEVTYNLYQEPVFINIDLYTSYTVTVEDYDSQGGSVARNDYFSHKSWGNADIIRFLGAKFSGAPNNTAINLTYNISTPEDKNQNGIEDDFVTQTTVFFVLGNKWMKPYEFSAEDYDKVGSGRFKNFDTQAQAEYRIGQYLNVHNPYVLAGEGYAVVYKLHIGSGKTENRLAYYTFDGHVWHLWAKTIQQSLKLSFDGTTWIPDNTIRYTLTRDQMRAIGADYKGTLHGDNLIQHGNFNINTGYWTEPMIIQAISNYLKTLYPDAEEGQKFLVTYETFKGSVTKAEIALILKNGVYVKQ